MPNYYHIFFYYYYLQAISKRLTSTISSHLPSTNHGEKLPYTLNPGTSTSKVIFGSMEAGETYATGTWLLNRLQQMDTSNLPQINMMDPSHGIVEINTFIEKVRH